MCSCFCIIYPNYCKMEARHDEMNHPQAHVCLSSCSTSDQFNTYGHYEKVFKPQPKPTFRQDHSTPCQEMSLLKKGSHENHHRVCFCQEAKKRLTSSIEWALKDRLKWGSRPSDDFGKWQLIILGKPCLIACNDILEGVQKWSLRQC